MRQNEVDYKGLNPEVMDWALLEEYRVPTGRTKHMPAVSVAEDSPVPRNMAEATLLEERGHGAAPPKSFLRSVGEYMPFTGAISRGIELKGVHNAARAIAGKTAGPSEWASIAQYLKEQETLENRSWGAAVADLAAHIPGFATEFLITGGVYTGVKQGVKKGGEKLAEKMVAKGVEAGVRQSLLKGGTAVASRAAGAAAQAMANPQLIAEDVVRRMGPKFNLGRDDVGQLTTIIQDQGDSFAEALPKAYLNTFIEMASERTGGRILQATGISALKGAVARRWLSKPGRTVTGLQALLKKAGWHGPIGEILEERVGEVARGATGIEETFGVTGDLIGGDRVNALRQLSIEAAAFMVPGSVAAGVAGIAERKTKLDAIAAKVEAGGAPSRTEAREIGIPEEEAQKGPSRREWFINNRARLEEAHGITKPAAGDSGRGARPGGEGEVPGVDRGTQPGVDAGPADAVVTPETAATAAAPAPAPVATTEPAAGQREGPAGVAPPSAAPGAPLAAVAAVAAVPGYAQEYLDSVPLWKEGRHEWDIETRTATTTLPSGRVARTKFDADAQIAAMAKQKGRKAPKGAYVYRTGKRGQFEEGTIYLATDATHETLNHEAVHWMEDNDIVTANEVAQHGGREGLARSYAEWAVDHKEPNGLFQRIYDTLEKLFSARRKLFEDIGGREAGAPVAETPVVKSKGRKVPAVPADLGALFEDTAATVFVAPPATKAAMEASKQVVRGKKLVRQRQRKGPETQQLLESAEDWGKDYDLDAKAIVQTVKETILPDEREKVRDEQQFKKDIHSQTNITPADVRAIINKGLDHAATPAQIEREFGRETARSRKFQVALGFLDKKATVLANEYPERLGASGDALADLWAALGQEKPLLPKAHDRRIMEAAVEYLRGGESEGTGPVVAFDVGGEVDPEVAAGVVEEAKATVEAGLYEFAAFVKRVAKRFGRDVAISLDPQLRRLWDGVAAKSPQMDQSSSVKAILGAKPKLPAPAAGPAGQTAGTEQTSVKHANVEASRLQRGEYPLESDDAQTFEEWKDEAQRQIAEDPNWIPRLIENLQVNPRALSEIETAGLAIHYTAAKNSYERVANKLQAQREAGAEPAAMAEAQTNAEFELGRLRTIEEIARAVGTSAGRALVSRKITLERDYSLASLTLEAVTAKGGVAPTAEESAQIATLAKEIKQLKAKLAEAQKQEDTKAVGKAIDQQIASVPVKPRKKPQARKGTKKAKKAAAVVKKDSLGHRMAAMLKGTKPDVSYDVGDGITEATPEMQDTALELAKAYIDLDVATVTEFLAKVSGEFGIDVIQHRNLFEGAWDRAGGASEAARPSVGPGDLQAVSKLAKQIMRFAVEMGIREREEVVDVVHEELQAAGFANITRRQTMDAMSGYGDFSPLSMDDVNVTLRDIRGQLQQLAKLDDMAAGRAPKKTGPERRDPSEEERHLIQQVNEAKKRGGFVVTNPAAQLKSALASAKTAVKNRIADMEKEIDDGEKIVRKRTSLKADAELTALRKRRDALREVWDEAFPKAPATEAQKIAAATRALDRAIATLEADLKAGRLGPKSKGRKLQSPALDAGRARMDALRAQREEMRANDPKYQEDLEARQNAAYKASLTNRLADWKQRIADKDFAPKPRAERALSKEVTDIQYRIEQEKTKFRKWQQEWKEARMSVPAKAGLVATRMIQLSRALVSAYDFSPFSRQGFVYLLAHPVKAAQAVPGMFKAFGYRPKAGKQAEYREAAKIDKRDNAQLYRRAKLAIVSTDIALGPQAEEFRGELNRYVPGVAGSERAYVTLLNRERADWFDILVDGFPGGQVTLEQAKVLAAFVNAGTGRGGLGKLETAAGNLTTVLFSPRLQASRLQMLSGYHAWRDVDGTRKVILKEYARAGASLAAVYSLWALAAAMWPDDDEEHKPTVTFDRRSSDFGKLRSGNTRFDILAGFSQWIVLLSRIQTGETVNQRGVVTALRGEDKPQRGRDMWDVGTGFVRTKFSPAISLSVNATTGEDYLGRPVTPGSLAAQAVTPMAMGDAVEAMQEHGFTKGSAVGMAAIMGVGVQVYQDGDIGMFRSEAYRLAVDRAAAKKAKLPFKEEADYRRAERLLDLTTKLRKLGKDSGQEEEVKKYIAGASRWGMRWKDEDRYPNPLTEKDLPADVQQAVNSHFATAADTASEGDLTGKDKLKGDRLLAQQAAEAYLQEVGVPPGELADLLEAKIKATNKKQGHKTNWDTIRKRRSRLVSRVK